MSDTQPAPRPRFLTRADRREVRHLVQQSLNLDPDDKDGEQYPFAEVNMGGTMCRFDLDPDGRPMIVSYASGGVREKVDAMKPGQTLNVLGWIIEREEAGLRGAPPPRINAPEGKKLGARDAYTLLEAMFNAELKAGG